MSQFRFYLEAVSGLKEKTLITEPVGWDESKPTITRDETYHGVMRTFTADLTFIQDGYYYLKELYEEEGILCNCLIYVYEYNNVTHEYELQDTGKIDFSVWDENDTYSTIGVTLSVTDTEFKEKIINREDTEINYDNSEDLDGNTMSDPEYIENTVYGMEVVYSGNGTVNSEDEISFKISDSVVPDSRWIFDLDMDDIADEIDGFQTVTGQMWDVTGDGSPFYPDDDGENDLAFFVAEADGTLKLSGSLLFDFYVNKSDGLTSTAAIFLVKYTASTDYASVVSGGWYGTGNGMYSDQTFDFDNEISYKEGDMLFLAARCGAGTAYSNTSYIVVTESTMEIAIVDKYEETTSKAALLFDVFNRGIESMTGVADAFVSTVLGEGGDYHDYSIQNGLLLRQYPEEDAAMSFKFKDLYQQLEKIFNIGLAINSDDTVEIRKKQDFFKEYVVYTVPKANMVVETFSKKIDTDYFFSDVEIGYSKSAYEEVSGLEEYNNESYYSTILSALNNSLEVVSTVRADGYGMEFARRVPYDSSETEDTSYDDDLFLLNIVKNSSGNWVQLTTEGFDSVTGLDSNVTTPANLKITPAQNLRRWGWMIATGLQKYEESKVNFTKADFASDLSTTLDGTTVTESESVPYSELEAPIFTGHVLTFEARLSMTDFNTLKADPYGIIKVWNPVAKDWTYGWIKEVSVESVDKDTNFELIEAISAIEVLSGWLTVSETNWLWNSGGQILLNTQS